MTRNNRQVCAACGGRCCQGLAGTYHPRQINWDEPLLLAAALRLGVLAIDWYVGDPRPDSNLRKIMHIRPAHAGVPGPTDPSWGGICGMLGVAGCAIPRGWRPLQCEDLKPDAHGYCHQTPGCTKQGMAFEWAPYQQQVEQVLKLAEDRR